MSEDDGKDDKVKVDTAWLQAEFERVYGVGWNRKAAKDMGIGPSDLSRLTRGGKRWSAEFVARAQTILRRPLEEIYRHVGLSTQPVAHSGYFKVTGRVGLDGHVIPGHGHEVRQVPAPVEMVEGYALLVRAGLSPIDGWILYYEPKTEDAARLIGRLCVIRVEGAKDPIVGILRRGVGSGMHSVLGFVGPAPVERDVRVVDAAPVLWLKT